MLTHLRWLHYTAILPINAFWKIFRFTPFSDQLHVFAEKEYTFSWPGEEISGN